MNKLKKTTLGTLIELQRGFDLPKSKFINGKYPVQSSNGVLGFHNEYKVKGPGITIGRSGTVGIPHLIQSNFYPHNTALFIKDFKGNNIEYIFYLLKQLKLGDKKSGSGVPTMNRNHLHPLKIVAYLDIVEQSKIAKVLSDLDKKIELNNKINAELESMAKLIYDYWFVQFDFPNAEGKPYKSSGGKMVWNEDLKREIPEGWKVSELGKHFKLQRGISYKSSELNETGIPMINLNSFNLDGTYKEKGIKIFSGKYSDKCLAKPGELLIAATDVTRNATIIGKAILVPDYYTGDLVYSMDIARILPSNELSESYLLMLFNSKYYHDYIKWFASGTLVLHLNTDGIKWFQIEVPPKRLVKNFDLYYSSIRKKISKNTVENQNLTQIRDWLLPMLMNGQVTVGDKEK